MRNLRSLALAGAVFLTPGLQAEPLEIGGPPYSSPSETSLRFAVLDTGSDISVKEMNNRGDFVGGNQRWVGTNASYQTLSSDSEYEFAYVADLSEDGTAVGRVTVNHIVGEGEGAWSWTEERGALWLPDSTDPVILQTPGVHIDFPDGNLTYLSAFARTIDGATIYGMGDHVWFQAGNSIHGQEAFAWGYAGLMWDVDESLTAPATQYDDWVCAGYGYYYNNLIEVIKARGEHTIDYWYWCSELVPQPPNGYYWESDEAYRVDEQRVSYYPMDINKFGAHIANSSAGWLPREQGEGVDFLQSGQARMPLPRLGTGTVALNSRRETNQAGVLCDFFQVVGNPVGGPILAEPELAGSTNYVTHTLNKLVPTNWPVHYVYDINDHGVIAAAANKKGASNPTTVLLLPIEIAPDILKSNGNFDEGRIDPQTNYALRDCDDEDLKADRDSYHDSTIKNGKIVTKDLHKNFFGARPDTLPEGWEDGATITIEKLPEIDPDTDRPETGEIRLHAIKDLGGSGEQSWAIQLTEGTPENPTPKNLVPQLYGPSATIPNGDGVNYWMEGIKPGPITLEFKYTKGSLTFTHKQKFKVVTEQSKAAWQREARNEILLETLGATDINNYQVAGGPFIDLLHTKYFAMNKDNILAVYKHYEKIYMVGQDKFLWAGLAKLAGAPVYAGLSDAQSGRLGGYMMPPLMAGVSGAVLKDIQTILVQANINIYKDLAWQFSAYRCSGIDALRFVHDQDNQQLNFAAWQEIDTGVFEDHATKISNGNIELLRREQRDILAQTYTDLDNIGFGLVSWMFSILAENPVPGGPDFSSWYELRLISNFNERWDWITRSGDGMWPLWIGTPVNTRKTWVETPLRTRADDYNLVPLAPVW